MNIKKIYIFLIFFLCILTPNANALNKSVIDITKMDITDLSKALKNEIITSEELVNLYLDRINEYNKQYNAIISINDEAINQAKKLDQERKEGNIKSILHGIPIIVKDNIDVFGMPTTSGSKALKDNYPKKNSYVVQKLIDSGAIILAKSNMSEFAFSARTSNSGYGVVKNAYNLEYTPYGSSGGSAVAVAASFGAAALGSDTNSSVRLPAAANNIIGLRPSTGLVSRTGILPYLPEKDTAGTLTKTVLDTLLIMNIINGYDKDDFKSINQNQKEYKIYKKNLEGITIGIPNDFLNGTDENNILENKQIYPEIKKLMDKAIKNLNSKKARIVYIEDYYNYTTNNWVTSTESQYTFCDSFDNYIKNTNGNIRNFKSLANSNLIISNLDYYASYCNTSIITKEKQKNKIDYENYILDIMKKDKIDVIMYPASKNKLSLLNDTTSLINISAHASSTIDYPAIALPLGFDKDGLSYGIEFMSKYNEEELLLNIAAIYEKDYVEYKLPEIAPPLYNISGEVEKLVNNYKVLVKKNKKHSLEKDWQDSVVVYFREYSSSERIEVNAESLNNKYFFNKGYVILLSILLTIIKLILVVVIIILIIFVILIIKRNRKKRRRLQKNNYKSIII